MAIFAIEIARLIGRKWRAMASRSESESFYMITVCASCLTCSWVLLLLALHWRKKAWLGKYVV